LSSYLVASYSIDILSHALASAFFFTYSFPFFLPSGFSLLVPGVVLHLYHRHPSRWRGYLLSLSSVKELLYPSTFTSHYVQTISSNDGAQILCDWTQTFACIFLLQCGSTMEELEE
jgi:hypothetical protein